MSVYLLGKIPIFVNENKKTNKKQNQTYPEMTKFVKMRFTAEGLIGFFFGFVLRNAAV